MRKVTLDPGNLSNQKRLNRHFNSNKISTTKYNLFSFLPKGLIMQFTRLSNCYFLLTTFILMFKGVSPVPAYT